MVLSQLYQFGWVFAQDGIFFQRAPPSCRRDERSLVERRLISIYLVHLSSALRVLEVPL
jgi:hypothetical protein